MLATRTMRIVIPGGTGKLGTLLARHFCEQGHLVSTITRFPKPSRWEAVHWDAEHLGHWTSSIEGADAVISLPGRSLNCRHTKRNQVSILHSRLRTTQLVAEAIEKASEPPKVWLNASTSLIYPDSGDIEMDESVPVLGQNSRRSGFVNEAARTWESATCRARTPDTRKILMRTAPVMSPESGGTFDSLMRLVRWGFAGDIGSGDQYVSWIHDFDFVRAVEYLIQAPDLDGPVNVCAPCPIPNHQFMCNLRRAWCTSYFGLSLPEWLVKAVALAGGSEPDLILRSRRVIPRKLMEAGFIFDFPEWRGACENLVDRWRRLHESQ